MANTDALSAKALEDRLKLHAYEMLNGGANATQLRDDLNAAAAALAAARGRQQAAGELNRLAQQTPWFKMSECPPQGAGGQVWVAYRNQHHPDGWTIQVQWTPIRQELGAAPEYWCPVARPAVPARPVGEDTP